MSHGREHNHEVDVQEVKVSVRLRETLTMYEIQSTAVTGFRWHRRFVTPCLLQVPNQYVDMDSMAELHRLCRQGTIWTKERSVRTQDV